MKKTLFLAVLALAGFASCGNAPKSNEKDAASTQSVENVETNSVQPVDNFCFTLVEMNGTPFDVSETTAEDQKPHVAFAEGYVNASVGCNQINAVYTTDDKGALGIEMKASTRMACPDGSREDEFVETFSKVVRYEFDQREIRFFDRDGNLVLKGQLK